MITDTCMVLGEVKMTYLTSNKISEQPQIHSSIDIERILRNIWEPETINYRETMYLLCLNKANRLLAWYQLSAGGISGTVCDAKIVFQCCLLCNATDFIIAHNHPSGSPAPSQKDIEFTKKLKEAGEIMEIQLLDSMILTDNKYYSFVDEGMI